MGAREHFFQLMLYMYIVKMKKKMYSLASIKGVVEPNINPSMLFIVMHDGINKVTKIPKKCEI